MVTRVVLHPWRSHDEGATLVARLPEMLGTGDKPHLDPVLLAVLV